VCVCVCVCVCVFSVCEVCPDLGVSSVQHFDSCFLVLESVGVMCVVFENEHVVKGIIVWSVCVCVGP